ncbi:hypothetical protein NL676_006705 [Syzygium grande]|nr:hypothetical protein NL676_006705 [Syzygium grande]
MPGCSFHVLAEAELPSCWFALCGVLVVCDVLPGVDRLFVPRCFYTLATFSTNGQERLCSTWPLLGRLPDTRPGSAEAMLRRSLCRTEAKGMPCCGRLCGGEAAMEAASRVRLGSQVGPAGLILFWAALHE